jgi:asparagine synthase (glutamine-hydrolysing)
MCGFIGEYAFRGNLTDKNTFLALNELGYARGPDSPGYWTDDQKIQLAFRRLAIRDLSHTGMQPMISSSGRYVIVYNGEIYNHQEIQGKFNPETRMKGSSDTEIILYAFEHFGVEKSIRLLDGMFAIALWDTFENALFLIRDFAGIKPLFYAINDQKIIFASQYDQICEHPDFKNESINKNILKLYLNRHHIPAPYAMLNKSFQVKQGYCLAFDSQGNRKEDQYWDFPKYKSKIIYNEDQALELLDAQLKDSVQSELVSDVPLGTFLSGGVDSPLISYYANAANRSRMYRSYTIGSDSSIHDEKDQARKYAAAMGIDCFVEDLNAGKVSLVFEQILDSMKEPFADYSIIPTFIISRFASNDLKVVLSGDGGDELFFGYERYYSVLKNFEAWKMPHDIRYIYYALDKVLFRNKHINSNFLFRKISAAHAFLHARFKEDEIHTVFPYLREVPLPDEPVFNYPDEESLLKMLNYMQKAEFYGMMQKTLRKVDMAAMANSLEVRVPFLKKSFIDTAMQIDPFLSYGRNKRKELLKKLLRKKIPDVKVYPDKRGFSVDLGKWIREDMKENFRQYLFEPCFLEAFEVDRKALQQMFDLHLSGKKDYKWHLFGILSLSHWYLTHYRL